MFRSFCCLAVWSLWIPAAHGAQVDSNPVSWSFEKPPVQGSIKAGATIRVVLNAEIREGWHLYSLKKMPSGGPIPTRITIPEGQAFKLDESKSITAPEPESVDDPVFGMEVEYFSGKAVFELPVKVDAGANGESSLKIAVRYQACNDKICLRPKTVLIETSLRVSP
ncbi:MAG: hypothetical protein FJW39_32860 [Acidobacteria bacterium]|nr:hypothetical protein [Acidobacteriota bacterium]